MEEDTLSDRIESFDDSARFSTCSTLAGELKDSDESDSRGGFMVPRKCDVSRPALTML
jgi:hypothetical protein